MANNLLFRDFEQLFFKNSSYVLVKLNFSPSKTIAIPEPRAFTWDSLVRTLNREFDKYRIGVSKEGQYLVFRSDLKLEIEFHTMMEGITGHKQVIVDKYIGNFFIKDIRKAGEPYTFQARVSLEHSKYIYLK